MDTYGVHSGWPGSSAPSPSSSSLLAPCLGPAGVVPKASECGSACNRLQCTDNFPADLEMCAGVTALKADEIADQSPLYLKP